MKKLFAVLALLPALLCAQTTPIVPAGLIFQAAAARGIQYIQPTAAQSIINKKAAINWHNLILNAVGVASMGTVTAGVTGLVHMSTAVLGAFAVGHTIYDAYGAPLLQAEAPNPNDIAPPLQLTGTVAPSAGACAEYSMFASGFAQIGSVVAKHRRFAAASSTALVSNLSTPSNVGGLLVTFTPQGVQVLRDISGGLIAQFEVVDVVACAPALPVVVASAPAQQFIPPPVNFQPQPMPPTFAPGSIMPAQPDIQPAPMPRLQGDIAPAPFPPFAIRKQDASAPFPDLPPVLQPNGYACTRDSNGLLFCANPQGQVFNVQELPGVPPMHGSCACVGKLEECVKSCADIIPISQDLRELPIRVVSLPVPPVKVQVAPREGIEARGRRLTAEGKYREAIAALEQAVLLSSACATCWNALGYAHMLNQEYAAAIKAFDTALAIQPGYQNAAFLRKIAVGRIKTI
jgi:hypothetical protein